MRRKKIMQESYINIDEHIGWKNYPIAQICINHLVHNKFYSTKNQSINSTTSSKGSLS